MIAIALHYIYQQHEYLSPVDRVKYSGPLTNKPERFFIVYDTAVHSYHTHTVGQALFLFGKINNQSKCFDDGESW